MPSVIENTQNISVDILSNRYIVVPAKQGDVRTRYVNVTMTSNGEKIAIPNTSDYRATVSIKTSQGTQFFNTCDIESDGTLTFCITSTMSQDSGKAEGEINIFQTETINGQAVGKRLSTLYFYLMIYPSVYDDDAIAATDEYNALVEWLEEAQEILSTIDTSMSSTSTNPVQNKVIKAYVDNHYSYDSTNELFIEHT